MGCGLRPRKPWHLVLPFSPREGRKEGGEEGGDARQLNRNALRANGQP